MVEYLLEFRRRFLAAVRGEVGLISLVRGQELSSRLNRVATSYPQSFSEAELRGLFRSTLKTIYR